MKKKVFQAEDKEIKKAIGLHIKTIRQNKRLSAEDVSIKLKVSREALTQIETGRNNVSAVTIWKLCCILGCDINDFFPNIPQGFTLTKRELGEIAKESEQAETWAKKLFGNVIK